MSTPVQVRHCLPLEWRGYWAFGHDVKVQKNAPFNEASTLVRDSEAVHIDGFGHLCTHAALRGARSQDVQVATFEQHLTCAVHTLWVCGTSFMRGLSVCTAPLLSLPTHSLSVVPRANSQTKSADCILGKHLTFF